MPESPAKFPDDLPSPSTANPQENERIPHIQDFLNTAYLVFFVVIKLPGKGVAGIMGQTSGPGLKSNFFGIVNRM